MVGNEIVAALIRYALAEEAWRSSRSDLPDGEPPTLSAVDELDGPADAGDAAEPATVAPIGHLHDGHDHDHDNPDD